MPLLCGAHSGRGDRVQTLRTRLNVRPTPTTRPAPSPAHAPQPKAKRHPVKHLLIALLAAIGIGVAAIAVIIFLAIAFGSDGSGASSSSDAPSAPKPPDLAVSASEILGAYKDNEVAADQRFKGKTIAITGAIEAIGVSTSTFKRAPVRTQMRGVEYYSRGAPGALSFLVLHRLEVSCRELFGEPTRLSKYRRRIHLHDPARGRPHPGDVSQ